MVIHKTLANDFQNAVRLFASLKPALRRQINASKDNFSFAFRKQSSVKTLETRIPKIPNPNPPKPQSSKKSRKGFKNGFYAVTRFRENFISRPLTFNYWHKKKRSPKLETFFGENLLPKRFQKWFLCSRQIATRFRHSF